MPSYQLTPRVFLIDALANDRPKAMAWVVDNKNNPTTSGLVKFYQPSNGGVLVEAEFFGLPDSSAANNSKFTRSLKTYTIQYTEFTGTWDTHNGIEVLKERKSFESDLECFQYVVYNLIGNYDEYYEFPSVDMNNIHSIREFLDIVNNTDPESVEHVILSIKRDKTTIYKTL